VLKQHGVYVVHRGDHGSPHLKKTIPNLNQNVQPALHFSRNDSNAANGTRRESRYSLQADSRLAKRVLMRQLELA